MPFPVLFLYRTSGISTTFPVKVGCITCPTVILVLDMWHFSHISYCITCFTIFPLLENLTFQPLFLFDWLHHMSYHISNTRELTFVPLFLCLTASRIRLGSTKFTWFERVTSLYVTSLLGHEREHCTSARRTRSAHVYICAWPCMELAGAVAGSIRFTGTWNGIVRTVNC